jgi:hypothetical protein
MRSHRALAALTMLAFSALAGGCAELAWVPARRVSWVGTSERDLDGRGAEVALPMLDAPGSPALELSFAWLADGGGEEALAFRAGIRCALARWTALDGHLETSFGMGSSYRLIDFDHGHDVPGFGYDVFLETALAGGGASGRSVRLGLRLAAGGWVGYDGDGAVWGCDMSAGLFLTFGGPGSGETPPDGSAGEPPLLSPDG